MFANLKRFLFYSARKSNIEDKIKENKKKTKKPTTHLCWWKKLISLSWCQALELQSLIYIRVSTARLFYIKQPRAIEIDFVVTS